MSTTIETGSQLRGKSEDQKTIEALNQKLQTQNNNLSMQGLLLLDIAKAVRMPPQGKTMADLPSWCAAIMAEIDVLKAKK